MSRPDSPEPCFSEAVRGCFSEGASRYPNRARLQAAVAQRLAGLSARHGVSFPPVPWLIWGQAVGF